MIGMIQGESELSLYNGNPESPEDSFLKGPLLVHIRPLDPICWLDILTRRVDVSTDIYITIVSL